MRVSNGFPFSLLIIKMALAMDYFSFDQFGLENLRRLQRGSPAPGHKEVLVQVRATSLNYRDLLMVEGRYNPKLKLPMIPLSDGAGVVIATGDGVERWKVGDRVMPIFSKKWLDGDPDKETLRYSLGGPLEGTLREEMIVEENALVEIPEHLSFLEGAALPCAALTAWSALFTYGQAKPGDTVLVQGTGGVSYFAWQFGLAFGLNVILTSGDNSKLEKLRDYAKANQLGDFKTINYAENPDWAKAALKIVPSGVDFVIEVGGANTFEQSIKCVRPGGTVSLIGILSGSMKDMQLTPILMRNIKVQGILVGNRTSFEQMCKALASKKLRPMIDKVFPFAESVDAFQYIRSAKHIGKICIDVNGTS